MIKTITESLPVAGGAAGSLASTAEMATQATLDESGLVSILTYLGFTILGALIGWLVRVVLNLIEEKVRNAFLKRREKESRPKKK